MKIIAYAASDTAIGEMKMNSATAVHFPLRLVAAAAAIVRTVLSGRKRSAKMMVWPTLLRKASLRKSPA